MIRADLHVHSMFSHNAVFGPSSAVEPWQALARASALGLDALAITDHDEIEGSLAAQEIADHWGVIVVPGVEVSTHSGHILALGVFENVAKGLSPAETIQAIHELSGLAVAAHPCNGLLSLRSRQIARLELDAVESYNARSLLNWRARQMARRLDIPQIGGSDAHCLQEIGNGLTLCPDDCTDWPSILGAIRAGETLARGHRARYLRHVARGHVKAAYRHQRDRLRRHTRKVILI